MSLEGTVPVDGSARAAAQGRRSWAAAPPFARALGLDSYVSAHYYECRLGPQRGQVDYLAAFSRGAASALQGRLSAAWAPSRQAPRAEALRRLVGAWSDGESLVSVESPTLWLEFDDHDLQAARTSLPSVSVCLVPGYDPERPLAAGQSARDLATAEDTLRHLRTETSGSDHLRACFESLPEHGRWIHLSVMLGRAPCAVKLYGCFPRRALLPYLRRIGWCGDLEGLGGLLEELYPRALVGEQAFVDLNLDTFRDPERCTLGLAFAQQHLRLGPELHDDRRQVLERLAAAGLCSEEEARTLRRWVAPQSADDGLPAALVPFRPFLDLKLVWNARKPLLAKAYLGSHQQRPLF